MLANIFCFFSVLLFTFFAAAVDNNAPTQFRCEHLTPERIAVLDEIAAKGDSKMRFQLRYKEYRAIRREGCDTHFKTETIEIFAKVVKKIREKIGKFVENFEQIEQISLEKIDELLEEIFKNAKLIISCKKLMMEILSEKGEGIRMNIFTFIKGAAAEDEEGEEAGKEFKLLGIVAEISKLQHPDLDALISADMWEEHLANAGSSNREGQKVVQRVVVEGGGPIGLLATFRLLQAGMDVKLVNNRMEYLRTRTVFLDANWQAQLRYFIGTKFDQLFIQQNAFGRIWMGNALISLKYLENALKNRLLEFLEFLKEKYEKIGNNNGVEQFAPGSENLPLELIYGLNIEDLQHPKSETDSQFYAILKQATDGKILRRIPFDLFICAGGANDQMRDKIFGIKARIRSSMTSHGTSEFAKEDKNSGITILKAPLIQPFEMVEMEHLIGKANFENITENLDIKFSRQVRKQLNGFGKNLLESGKQQLSSVETRELFVVSSETPAPLLDVFKRIEMEKRKMKAKKFEKQRENLDKLWQRIFAKWSSIVFDYYYENAPAMGIKPQYQLNINEKTGEIIENSGVGHRLNLNYEPLGSGLFNVQIRTMDTVVKEIENKFDAKKSALIAVLGDALASPHFYTGSGMSSGRMGVAFLVENIKKLNSGEIKEKEKFKEILTEEFELVKENVVEWAKKYIEILP